jgi:hypothetical protein
VPGAKDQLWYGDITYIFTMSGWAYLNAMGFRCLAGSA